MSDIFALAGLPTLRREARSDCRFITALEVAGDDASASQEEVAPTETAKRLEETLTRTKEVVEALHKRTGVPGSAEVNTNMPDFLIVQLAQQALMHGRCQGDVQRIDALLEHVRTLTSAAEGG